MSRIEASHVSHRVVRLLLLVVMATGASGCVSWMDSETLERSAEIEWVDVVASVDGASRIDTLGLYKGWDMGPDADVRAGLDPLVAPTVERRADSVVLGPGDRIEKSSGAPYRSTLKRRADIELRQQGAAGAVEISSVFSSGRCEVLAHQQVELVELRKVDRFARTPTGYTVGGEAMSPEAVDSFQALLWCVVPPVELGRLLTRAFGGRFVEPVGTVDEVFDSYFEQGEGAATHRLGAMVAPYGLW